MNKTFLEHLYAKHATQKYLISAQRVGKTFDKLLGILFPEHANTHFITYNDFESHYQDTLTDLSTLLNQILDEMSASECVLNTFVSKIPEIRAKLELDIDALTEGDPAASNRMEVIHSYPGFFAVAFYRMAHVLWKLDVPLIPRIITEYAHSHTGIDIHPGARIGDYFFIDHGTGVVIGETSVIGNRVKIYQGVTLGALSVHKQMAKTKRHPTIEDDVVIYSGATILGGETVIGKGTVIGGNVWLVHSVEPQSRVYNNDSVEIRN